MAKPPLDKPVTFGPFAKGVNNVDRSLTMGPDELVSAFNLDIDREGVLSRRSGYRLAVAAGRVHSLWARDNRSALYVAGADLMLLRMDEAGTLVSSALRLGVFGLGLPVSYVLVNGVVYYSNGAITGLIRADNTSHPWGVEMPPRAPILGVGGGNLPAGRYQVALQYIDEQGEFSGLTLPVAIVVPVNSSIVVSGIPAPASADVRYVALFVSDQNGEILYRYGTYVAGTSSATVSASAQQDRAQTTW